MGVFKEVFGLRKRGGWVQYFSQYSKEAPYGANNSSLVVNSDLAATAKVMVGTVISIGLLSVSRAEHLTKRGNIARLL